MPVNGNLRLPTLPSTGANGASATLPAISGYRLISELGRGSSSIVYLAIQENMGRKVALKLANAGASDTKSAARFLLEARIITRLSHPYIVAVHDVGEYEGRHFIAMEYLGGGNLKQRIRNGMTPNDAVRIIAQVTQALDFAHDQGFLHRDIKPGNILFRQDGSPVLTDFGIAHATSASALRSARAQSSLPPTQPSLPPSVSAIVVGTPRYMSPEQAKGKPLDRRSDLYAIGILFFELLTGRVPFDGNDALDIGIKHIKSRVPLLPPALVAYQPVLEKMLAKDADDRYQRGQAFINALQKIPLPSSTATAVTAGDKRHIETIAVRHGLPRRWLLLAIFAVLLMLMGLVMGQTITNSDTFNRGTLQRALH